VEDKYIGHFLRVYMNEVLLDEEHYSVAVITNDEGFYSESGSIMVTIFASHLETVGLGDHNFNVVFATGTASVTMSIVEDDDGFELWMILLILLIIAIIAATAYYFLIKKKSAEGNGRNDKGRDEECNDKGRGDE
jgi:hypothetical protein